MKNFALGVALLVASDFIAAQSVTPIGCEEKDYSFDAKLYVGVPADQSRTLPPSVIVKFSGKQMPDSNKRLSILKKCLILAAKKYSGAENIGGSIDSESDSDEEEYQDYLDGRLVFFDQKKKSVIVKKNS